MKRSFTVGLINPRAPPAVTSPLPTDSPPVLRICEEDVLQLFKTRKISYRSLELCELQLMPKNILSRLTQLTVPTSACQCIATFLTDRKQQVRLEIITFSSRTITAGAPQGYVWSPLLFLLHTNDCTSAVF